MYIYIDEWKSKYAEKQAGQAWQQKTFPEKQQLPNIFHSFHGIKSVD